MSLKIIELDITNTRKIKAFQLVLDGENMNIAGDVSQGKTTAINSLWEILSKKNDSLTHGEKKGTIKIRLGGDGRTIIAERKNTKKGSTVNVYFEDSEDKITIADFKKMLSTLSVNPHKLMDLGQTELIKTLARSAKLEIDLDDVDDKISKLEQKRLDLSRDIDLLNPGGKPEKVEKVVLNDLVGKLDNLKSLRQGNEDDIEEILQIANYQEELMDEVSDFHGRISSLMGKHEEAEKRKKELKPAIDSFIDVNPEIGVLKLELSKAQETNENNARYEAWLTRKKDQDSAIEHRGEVNEEILELRGEKRDALSNAKWPIDGLSIENGVVIFNGCELSNLGTSEQILVTSAIAINDINNHQIKVVRLDGIEAMSKDHFDKLTKLFNDNGIQVLSTRVSRGEIEDNEIQIIEGRVDGTN